MLGLTPLGTVHTAISLIAVAAGAISLLRFQKITWHNKIGQIYVVATILTCLTALGIFQHGGFGKGHALAILEIAVIGIALASGRKTSPFGGWSTYVETVSYSFSFFLHLIPGITETTTRLPQNHPIASGPDDPMVQTTICICFVLFLIGVTLQVLRIRRRRSA
jgi:hypothetical protein